MNDLDHPSTDVLTLTKQLVAIPSYVDRQHDESRVIDFIALFFKEHLPAMSVERQLIHENSRGSNLVVSGGGTTDMFVLGHVDTVQPTDNWKTPPLEPTMIGDRLYGLGVADMKGSLAAFLCALTKASPNDLSHLMILLYVDEEYNFQGTKRFLRDQTLSENPPKLIISLDGSLELASGCRGLIEFNAKITGKSGHSSNPSNGNNVILSTVEAVKLLEQDIRRYSDKYLGESTLNLAYMRAGITERHGSKTEWLREGNVIPDSCDVTLEVRTADKELNSEAVTALFERYVKERGLSIASMDLRHDYGPWNVSYESPIVPWLKDCYDRAGVEFSLSDRRFSGFIDVQMVTEVVDCPTFVIGVGGDNKHGADENIETSNLTKLEDLYLIILDKSGEKE